MLHLSITNTLVPNLFRVSHIVVDSFTATLEDMFGSKKHLEDLERLYSVIGQFVANFNGLEHEVGLRLAEEVFGDESGDAAISLLIGTMQFRQKVEAWARIISFRFPHTRAEVNELRQDLIELIVTRDKILHGIFELDDEQHILGEDRFQLENSADFPMPMTITVNGVQEAIEIMTALHDDFLEFCSSELDT